MILLSTTITFSHSSVISIHPHNSSCDDPSSNTCTLVFTTDEPSFQEDIVSKDPLFLAFIKQVKSSSSLTDGVTCDLSENGLIISSKVPSYTAVCLFILKDETYISKSSIALFSGFLSTLPSVVYVGALYDLYQWKSSSNCQDPSTIECSLSLTFPRPHPSHQLSLNTTASVLSSQCTDANTSLNLTPTSLKPFNLYTFAGLSERSLITCDLVLTKNEVTTIVSILYDDLLILNYPQVAYYNPTAIEFRLGEDCSTNYKSLCSIMFIFPRDIWEQTSIYDDLRFHPTAGFATATHTLLKGGWKYDVNAELDNPKSLNSCPQYLLEENPNFVLQNHFVARCLIYRKQFQYIGPYIGDLIGSYFYNYTVDFSHYLAQQDLPPITWDVPVSIQFDESTCNSDKTSGHPDSPFCKMTYRFFYQGEKLEIELNKLPSHNSQVEFLQCSLEVTFVEPASFQLSPLGSSWLERNPETSDGAYFCEIWVPKYDIHSEQLYTNIVIENISFPKSSQFFSLGKEKFELSLLSEPFIISRYDYMSLFTVSYDQNTCNSPEVEMCQVNITQRPFSRPNEGVGGIYNLPYNFIRKVQYMPLLTPIDMSNDDYTDYFVSVSGLDEGVYDYDGASSNILKPNYAVEQQTHTTTMSSYQLPLYWHPNNSTNLVGYSCYNHSSIDPENQYYLTEHVECDGAQFIPPAYDYRTAEKTNNTIVEDEINIYKRRELNSSHTWMFNTEIVSTLQDGSIPISNYDEGVTFTLGYRKKFPLDQTFANFTFNGFAGIVIPGESVVYQFPQDIDQPLIQYSPEQACTFDETCTNPFQMDCNVVVSRRTTNIKALYFITDTSIIADVNEQFVPFMNYSFKSAYVPIDSPYILLLLFGQFCHDGEFTEEEAMAYDPLSEPIISLNYRDRSTGELKTAAVYKCNILTYPYVEAETRLELAFRLYKKAGYHGLGRLFTIHFEEVDVDLDSYPTDEEKEKMMSSTTSLVSLNQAFTQYLTFVADGIPKFKSDCSNSLSSKCSIEYSFNSIVQVADQTLIKHWIPDSRFIQSLGGFSCSNLKNQNTVTVEISLERDLTLPLMTDTWIHLKMPKNGTGLTMEHPLIDGSFYYADFVPIDPAKPIVCNLELYKQHHASKITKSAAVRTFPLELFLNNPNTALTPIEWPNETSIRFPRISYSVFRTDIMTNCYLQSSLDLSRQSHCIIAVTTRGSPGYPMKLLQGHSQKTLSPGLYPLLAYSNQSIPCIGENTQDCSPIVGMLSIDDTPTGGSTFSLDIQSQYQESELTSYIHFYNDNYTPKVQMEQIVPISIPGGQINQNYSFTYPQQSSGIFFEAYPSTTYAYSTTYVKVEYTFNAIYPIDQVVIHSNLGLFKENLDMGLSIDRLPCLEKNDNNLNMSVEEYLLYVQFQNSTKVSGTLANIWSETEMNGKTFLQVANPGQALGKTCFVFTLIDKNYPTSSFNVLHEIQLQSDDGVYKPIMYTQSYSNYVSAPNSFGSTYFSKRVNQVNSSLGLPFALSIQFIVIMMIMFLL